MWPRNTADATTCRCARTLQYDCRPSEENLKRKNSEAGFWMRHLVHLFSETVGSVTIVRALCTAFGDEHIEGVTCTWETEMHDLCKAKEALSNRDIS